MSKKEKFSFTTKLLSNHHYLSEVSVEGRTTRKFYSNIAHYDTYVAQIIRGGNCVTLLSNPISITGDNFWKVDRFEGLARYVFWTFNESFLFVLLEKMQVLKLPVLTWCKQLLTSNITPHEGEVHGDADEEVKM